MPAKRVQSRSPRMGRQHGKPCFWCKKPMRVESAKWRPTRDHVIPKSQGGTILRICCHCCNHLKGDMPPALWLVVLEIAPDIHDRFDTPGPRGMSLFYTIFGRDFEPHIDRIVKEAQARFPEYGEVKL